jgi:nucleotide-binding universal stress UspA family protein
MLYKTIVLHCNDKRRIAGLLVPAVRLAETFQAHLIGLSIVPPVAVISAGAPEGMPIIVDDHCKLYREENPTMKSAFESATRGRPFVSEWRDDEADAFGVGDRVPQYARAVDLVIASQSGPDWPGTDIPAADICAALARHGVPCEATEQLRPRVNVGETLLACAKDFAADLMVMGCYGHTRLREFVFGGASRQVLKNMSIPVLMSL